MKIKWLVLAIACWLLFLTGYNYPADITSRNGSYSSGTSVQAVAEPEYSFKAPPDTTILYPNKEAVIGDLIVGDLFLESDEWLTVTVVPGRMTNRSNPGLKLSYNICCYTPIILNELNSGEAYSVAIRIDSDSFKKADPGIYTASLLFKVISHPNEKVVWEGTTFITAKKPGISDEDKEPGTEPGKTPGPSPTVSPGKTMSPGETASPGEKEIPEATQRPGSAHPPEQEPLTPGKGNIALWCIIAVIVLLILLLLYLGIRKRSEK